MDYDIKDIELAEKGRLRIEWAEQNKIGRAHV